MYIKIFKITAAVLLALAICSCGQEGRKEYFVSESETAASDEQEINEAEILLDVVDAEISGEGASLADDVLLISRGGVYRLSGSFNGTVVVDITKAAAELVLCGVDIYSKSAAIYVKSADKVTITLENGTENVLSDGRTYAIEDDAEPSACLYSADDLTIKGSGSLKVNAYCRNGIQTKNDLRIKDGNITVTSPKNALKGKDSVQISGGRITVINASDAIKSDNEKEDGRGVVIISGGELFLNCQDDAVQAFRSVSISGCTIQADAGDKIVNCDGAVEIEDGCICE